MNCPRCKTALTPKIYEANIEVDTCATCGGLWLDKGELERIEETIEHDYSASLSAPENVVARTYEMANQSARPDIDCPKCVQKMTKTECHPASLIMVDLCASCAGIWLERGEIQALETYYERLRQEERKEAKRGFFGSLRGLFG